MYKNIKQTNKQQKAYNYLHLDQKHYSYMSAIQSISFLSLCLSLFASGQFQSGKAAANWLTSDLADNAMTETDDSHEL